MPHNTLAALEIYRHHFQPSPGLPEPYAMIGVAAVCADSDDQARWLHGPAKLSFLRLRTGRPSTLPSPEEAAAYDYPPDEREFIDSWTASHIVGSPEAVRTGLLELQQRTAADELMLTTNVHDHADRLHSYQLIAETMNRSLRAQP
jgi:alkanesulfonate monooxygenase SsuD/methylene tetrahydromethanopterin reductase-like flavin-dependent oxidoreductase (luciferase family)